GESLSPIHWALTTQNGRLSSSPYIDPLLLKNKPYLFLITVEQANTDPQVASLAPGARLYYAALPYATQPASSQQSATFDIQSCPQNGTSGVCVS
ncbi:MAG TPA: hypothetical protein VEU97_18495, partial [Ktedonobacteraceae bacterium]|nr:hypothetical protein [Ktedonobacteraceae bacterium]